MNEHNTNQKLWQKKFGNRYFGYVSRLYQWLLKRKTKIDFLNVTKLPIVFYSVAKTKTASQPKQVVFHPKSNLAFVSCMKGKRVQIFNCNQNNLELVDELFFRDQCVELAIYNNLCLVTLSRFSRIPGSTDKLAIIDIESRKILSTISTGGNWSKFIEIHPSGLIFVSNWRSNNLSIIDISDILHPKVIQLLPCGISPRGIAFIKSGELGLVAGFYSQNIIEIRQKSLKLFEVSFIGDPYNYPNYSGSMRDVVIDSSNKFAYISNLKSNLLHIYHIPNRNIVKSLLMGKYPNSIRFFNSFQTKLLVSCRESNTVCLLDIETCEVEGCSELNTKKSTGLSIYPDGFLVTSFKENLLELHKIIKD